MKNILMNEGDIEKEVVLDIGKLMHVGIQSLFFWYNTELTPQATLSIIFEHQILVTSCITVSLYEVPQLEPVITPSEKPVVAYRV